MFRFRNIAVRHLANAVQNHNDEHKLQKTRRKINERKKNRIASLILGIQSDGKRKMKETSKRNK